MVYIILFVLLVLFDQITKAIAFAYVSIDSPTIYWIGKVFGIDTLKNTGMSYGIASDEPWAMPVFIVLSALALVVMFFAVLKLNKKRRFLKVSIVLLMAGAAGNLIDRCVLQYVRDLIFMDFTFLIDASFMKFSNNIADIVITVGAIMFIIALLFVDTDAVFRRTAKDEARAIEEAAQSLSQGEQEGEKIGQSGSDEQDGAEERKE